MLNMIFPIVIVIVDSLQIIIRQCFDKIQENMRFGNVFSFLYKLFGDDRITSQCTAIQYINTFISIIDYDGTSRLHAIKQKNYVLKIGVLNRKRLK